MSLKKKITGLAVVLFASVTMGAHAEFGIGIQGNIGLFGGGPSLLISPSQKLHFTLDWYIPFSKSNKDILFNLAADIWVLDLKLAQLGPGELKLFAGPGFFARFGIRDYADNRDDEFVLAAGLRIPIGVHYRLQGIDPFFMLVPALDIKLLPAFNIGDWFGFGGALGVRFWI
ncbi:MAG: hypothetical protein LBD20_03970 [Spirochaetaceae bacterium]|jgi:hypothetical protein|nr:hypothetical protein [Spirochaetaceae bacterium]